jgi:uncharacterized membrane protein YidH (DUF202 family)
MADRAGTEDRPDDIEERDPGLARERTTLAWTRTAISFAAVGAAILKSDPPAGAVVLALSMAIWSLGRLAARTRLDPLDPPGLTRQHTLQLITVATTIVSLAALAIALLARSLPIR